MKEDKRKIKLYKWALKKGLITVEQIPEEYRLLLQKQGGK